MKYTELTESPASFGFSGRKRAAAVRRHLQQKVLPGRNTE